MSSSSKIPRTEKSTLNSSSTVTQWEPLSTSAARKRRRMRDVHGRAENPNFVTPLDSLPPFVGRVIENTFPVAERFVSINGEGAHSGRLSVFIRFSGCNLECTYCDTRWACDPACTVAFYSIDEITSWVNDQSVACVTITGGEPLLQDNLPHLVRDLCDLPSIEVVEIETNGSLDLARVAPDPAARLPKLTFTMDYKLPSSGMQEQMRTENFDLLTQNDIVKFVLGTDEDLAVALETMRAFSLEERCQVYFSPVAGKMEPARIVDFMKDNALTSATLQLQLHKIVWPSAERGV